MRVPAADVDEGDFKPDLGLDERCGLSQCLAKWRTRIFGAIGGLILLRIGILEPLHGLEGFPASALQAIGDALRVEGLEPLGQLTVVPTALHVEVRNISQRDGWGRASEHAWQDWTEGHRTEWRGL